MDGTGLGSCPVASFGISGAKPAGSTLKVSDLVRRISGKQFVTRGGGWNWLWTVPSGRFGTGGIET